MSSRFFFTADLHAHHRSIIEYCDRPFIDVKHMNENLIERWNSKVNANDNVFIIGDVSFGNQEMTVEFIKQLRGKIHVILGNHDKFLRGPVLNFLASEPVFYKELSFAESRMPRGKQDVILFHYPILSWNKAFYKSWHLHGHVHSKKDKRKRSGRLALDVGVDGNDFYPYSYDEIVEIMLNSEDPKDE